MRTYWNASVSVDGACKCSTGADELREAISRAVADCVYYQAQYPASAISFEVIEHCAECHNEGTVRNYSRIKFTRMRCPNCKGKLAQGKIENVQFRMPDSANNIRLLAS